MSPEITYVFRDGKTYAIRQGKVIAASTDNDEVERQVKQAYGDGYNPLPGERGPDQTPHIHDREDFSDPAGEQFGQDMTCPGCGLVGVDTQREPCPQCGYSEGQSMENPYPYDEPSPGIEMGGEAGPYMAKVVTPNGLKGTVLGKVAGVWGDEVTVRLENGRIVRLPVGTELHAVKTASTPQNPIEQLERRLAVTPDGTRDSLVARSTALDGIQKQAAYLIREGVSWSDTQRLDQISVTAAVEQEEIKQALAHLDDVEAIAPPSFSMGVAHEAAGISREDASWLDNTLDEMIKEAEAQDFTKLMDEGPEAFTAELPDVALADVGVTRQMASSFIAEKTAGIARETADPYMETFLTRVEECRRAELSTRKQATTKEAAAEEDKYKDLPDDAFFL